MSIAANLERRDLAYAALRRRNRIITALRIAVPSAGAIVLVMMVAGIIVGSLTDRFGFANIHIDRNNLVVDSPELSATAPNGNSYSLTAAEARAAVGDLDTIDVTGGVLGMRTPDGRELSATYDHASLETGGQVVTVRGTAEVSGNQGISGTITDIVWDVPNQALRSSGPLNITLPGDKRIVADGVEFDAAAGIWRFSKVEVTLPDLPGAPQ